MSIDLTHVILGFAVLAFLYILLSFEVMHRTAATLFTVAVLVILNMYLHFIKFSKLIESIDMNTIVLLMCMMMLVSVLSRTNVFSYLAREILHKLRGSPYIMIFILSGITAFVSAFIDNVTTVLLISPVVLEITRRLRVDPRPVLLAIVFASNIGGTATLVGDPPNILIGSAAKLSFMAFIRNLTPIVIADFFLFMLVMKFLIKGWLRSYPKEVKVIDLGGGPVYVRRVMLSKVLIALVVVIALFALEDFLEYPPSIPPLVGIGLLLVMTRRTVRIDRVLRDVDWSTLVFFMAMFIVIKGVEALGVMEFIANGILSFAKEYTSLMLVIVWVSAFVSAFIDNIPFVMSMIPVIKFIATATGLDPTPLYWSLSLGGCLGGNGTLIGASANVVVAGIADRHGHHISFASFIKYGMPVMISTVALSSVYLIIRYALLVPGT